MNSGSECQTKTDRQIEDQREREECSEWLCCCFLSLCARSPVCRGPAESQAHYSVNGAHQPMNSQLMNVEWLVYVITSPTTQLNLNSMQPTDLKLSTACIWCSSGWVSFPCMDWCMEYDGVPAAQVRCWPQKCFVFKCLILLEWRHPGISTFCGLHSANGVGVLTVNIKVMLKIRFFFHCFRIKAWACQTF